MAYVIGNDNKIPFAAYHTGVKTNYTSDNVSATLSVVDAVYGTNSAGGSAEDLGFEAQVKFTGVEGFIFQIGTAQDDQSAATVDKFWNFWVNYNGIDNLILGAEFNTYEFNGEDANSWMLMGNYSFTEKADITLRYSDVDEDNLAYEADKFTVASSYSITDNLLGRVEYSIGEADGSDVDYFAVQALWTF